MKVMGTLVLQQLPPNCCGTAGAPSRAAAKSWGFSPGSSAESWGSCSSCSHPRTLLAARGDAKAPSPCSVPDGKALKLSSLTERGAGEKAPLPRSLAPFCSVWPYQGFF